MALRITIDIFSGRKNPTIELRDAKLPKGLKLPSLRKLLVESVAKKAQPSVLGYRGLILEETNPKSNLFGRQRLVENESVAEELLERVGHQSLTEFLVSKKGPADDAKLRRALKTFREFAAEKERKSKTRPKTVRACQCAPLYEPAWWNDDGQHQWNNNCYNYATNYRSDTFAQPGLAAGQMYTALQCPNVHAAALADDLLDTPIKNECPKEGHLVALVVAPDFDFHWYRKGRDGYWTHKPGGTAVTNLDNSGNAITDPRTADRGPYTDFCHFMVVMHGHIKLQ